MKIPLRYIEAWNFLSLPGLISIHRSRIFHQPIEFLIDTGSSLTFISELDFKRLQINKNLLVTSQKERHLRIGGGTYNLFTLSTKTEFHFKTENETSSKFEIPSIEVSLAVSQRDSKMGEGISIIGTDFLKTNEMVLHANFKKHDFYLEK